MFRFREITYAKNCVFACVHKEIDNALFPGANYSFRESGLQITSHLLSSSFGSCSLTLASKIAANFLLAFNFAQENITNHFICASKSFSFKTTRHTMDAMKHHKNHFSHI